MKRTKRRDLKFTWSSNGHFTNSGYGVFTRDLLFRLRDDKWKFAEIAWYGLDSYPVEIDGIKVYPKMGDPFGSDAIVFHTADYGANAVFTMQDVWTLQPPDLAKIQTWIPYVPIDKDPVPPMVLDRLRFAYKIITFSKFGQDTLEKFGYTSTLIPEGTDTNIFKPMDKVKCREELKLPQDAFIFGSIAANKENPPRKGFQEMLDAFKLFYENHKEGALFFHTQQTAPGNFPILEYANHLGFADRVFFLNQYQATHKADSHEVAKELNAFDVNLHPSQTEGFGLVIIEAQSCGVPVIVNRCQSMPELVVEGKTGEICEVDKPRWTSDNGYVFPANVASLHDKMETLYKKLHEENTIAKDAREHIVKNYSIDTIFKEKWIPFFEDLQEELLPLTKAPENTNIVTAEQVGSAKQ